MPLKKLACIISRSSEETDNQLKSGPEVIKLFSCSTPLSMKILNAHKYKYIKKFSFFSDSDKPRMLFFLLINVKMPTIVGILIFMRRKHFVLS